MPKAPYPLGGEARDVVDDVRRLGGFGIAAHPDSPKTELSWRDWSAPFDGIEFLNPDTSWREQIAAGIRRPRDAAVAPAGAAPPLVSVPPGRIDRRPDSADTGAGPMGGGVPAPARRRRRRRGRPRADRLAVGRPGHDARGDPDPELRRVLSHDVRPRPAGACAHRGRRRRRGPRRARDSRRPPVRRRGRHRDTAGVRVHGRQRRRTARAGDELPAAGGPITLRVRSNAPPSFSTAVWNGAALLSGGHHEQDFTVAAPGGAGVYWVEIRPAGSPAVPWITSNPIYVRAPDAPAAAPRRHRK